MVSCVWWSITVITAHATSCIDTFCAQKEHRTNTYNMDEDYDDKPWGTTDPGDEEVTLTSYLY